MTGDGEMRVPVPAVQRHAGSADTAADGIENGRAAAAHVQMGAEAYGQICAFLPGLINPLADRTVAALGELTSGLRETATRLRTVASTAESTDTASAQRVTASGRRIELPL
ncbi:ESX-1 secretion-associated protein [Plantactinospora soyae]|uniref:ESX-1 secretion-associated protein n=1 Tax=Plantactinospora soyae TaxID=1544732 RepID=A0A927QZG8_9ACTN|nr:ESX-1 secretion-associated protein [Plantactinospora soyae]MBE1489032.1 hypothetical protein [Plantactinospora soyae]